MPGTAGTAGMAGMAGTGTSVEVSGSDRDGDGDRGGVRPIRTIILIRIMRRHLSLSSSLPTNMSNNLRRNRKNPVTGITVKIQRATIHT